MSALTSRLACVVPSSALARLAPVSFVAGARVVPSVRSGFLAATTRFGHAAAAPPPDNNKHPTGAPKSKSSLKPEPVDNAGAADLYSLEGKLDKGEHFYHQREAKFNTDDPREVRHHEEDDKGFATSEFGTEGWFPSEHPRLAPNRRGPPPEMQPHEESHEPTSHAEAGPLEGLRGKLLGGVHHEHKRTGKFALDEEREVKHFDEELDAGYTEAEKTRVGGSQIPLGVLRRRRLPEDPTPHASHSPESYGGADALLDLKPRRVYHGPPPLLEGDFRQYRPAVSRDDDHVRRVWQVKETLFVGTKIVDESLATYEVDEGPVQK